MGKYLSVIMGAVVALLGIMGLAGWWYEFTVVLKGSVPVMLIFGGIIAAIAGLSEIRDEAAAKNK